MAFKKGESGNPSGRTKGSAKIEPLRAGLIEHVPEILDALVTQAKAGDIQASKLILERVLPPLKNQAAAIEIPLGGTLAEQGNAIIQATLTGQIPPDSGTQLLTALVSQCKIIEVSDLLGRLESLERQKENEQDFS